MQLLKTLSVRGFQTTVVSFQVRRLPLNGTLSSAQVQDKLGLSDEVMHWLLTAEQSEALRNPVLPDDAKAAQLLERLDVNAADRADTLAARPDPEAQPELWWVLCRSYGVMFADMGRGEPVTGFKGWPGLPASLGALGRHLYVWLFLAVLPDVRRFHAERGIPDDISWDTLTVLGRAMDEVRTLTGLSGLGALGQWGVPIRFRGADYQLGRLSFNRGEFSVLGRTHGHVLNVHIPPFGRLDSDACDDSFAQARSFFPRHFPEEPVAFFVCHSWLMDDQLASYLPESSNLVQFQRRFRLLPEREPEVSDADILAFVFNRAHDSAEVPLSLLETLPQETALQRAFVSHLRSGKHWYSRTGWLEF